MCAEPGGRRRLGAEYRRGSGHLLGWLLPAGGCRTRAGGCRTDSGAAACIPKTRRVRTWPTSISCRGLSPPMKRSTGVRHEKGHYISVLARARWVAAAMAAAAAVCSAMSSTSPRATRISTGCGCAKSVSACRCRRCMAWSMTWTCAPTSRSGMGCSACWATSAGRRRMVMAAGCPSCIRTIRRGVVRAVHGQSPRAPPTTS